MEMKVTTMMMMEMVALEKVKRSYLLKRERAMAKIPPATMAIPRKGLEKGRVAQEKRMEKMTRKKMVMTIMRMMTMMTMMTTTMKKTMRMKVEMRKRKKF